MRKIIRKIIKRYWGIDGISLFLKKQEKKVKKNFYKKKYSTEDLINVMCEMGMKEGSVVFIHSSMSEFYNYIGTPKKLIRNIIDIIGTDGTLMMPAYPKDKRKLYEAAKKTNEVVFDVKNTASGAGYMTEVFRKYPGVKRSINLQHSVCAYGKLAQYFVSDHHLSKIAWDEYSPYYKLGNIEGLIFCLGLDSHLRNVTMIHCTETKLREKYTYFASFFGKKITYKYLDQFNNIGTQELMLPINGGVRSSKVIKKEFSKKKFRRRKLSNLSIEVVDSMYMYKTCIGLAKKGISIYKKPSTKGYLKNGVFINNYEAKK